MKFLSRLLELVRMTVRRFAEDHGLRTAGSLTYTTLLSLVPLITVALALLSAFPVFRGLAEAIQDFVFNNLLPDSVDVVQDYAAQFVDNAARLTTVGIVLLVVTAITLLLTIDEAFNGIWRVRRKRPVVQRLLIYWAVITIGPLLIGASLTLTSWLVGASAGWMQDIPHADTVLIKLSAMALTSAALALLYFAMPNRPVRAADALLGGVLAGVAFEFTKQGFGVYITHFPTYTVVYGAFAAVPVFLLWVYVSWVVVVAGAVLVAALPEWRQHAASGRLAPGSQFVYALQVLKMLWQAQGRAHGGGMTVAQLHAALNLRYERIEALLDTMARAAWVKRAEAGGWALYRNPADITLADVYQRFVFDAQALAHANPPELAALAQTLAERINEGGGMSLAEWFESAAAEQQPSGTTG